jgi:hypothetical protein
MDSQMSHSSECQTLFHPSDKPNQHTNTHISNDVSSWLIFLHYNVGK